MLVASLKKHNEFKSVLFRKSLCPYCSTRNSLRLETVHDLLGRLYPSFPGKVYLYFVRCSWCRAAGDIGGSPTDALRNWFNKTGGNNVSN